ncbi:MAG: hypothetical protein Q7T69_17380 [Rhodoferax sp.]|nr:hypothetical protein [Rhodoferax sp.]
MSFTTFKPETTDPINWALGAFAVAFSCVLATYASVMPQISNDFWLQAKVGELVLLNGEIPSTLLFPFSIVRDYVFNSHEWLPSVGFHLLVYVLGEGSLPLVLGALGLALFVSVVQMVYQRSGKDIPWSLTLGLLAIATENFRHLLRPELFTLFLLIWTLMLMHCYTRTGSKYHALGIVGLGVIWANCHASVVLAPVLVGAQALGTWLDRYRKSSTILSESKPTTSHWATLTILVTVATLVNPSGWRLWQFALGFGADSLEKRFIIEWLSPFHQEFRSDRWLWIGAGVTLVLLYGGYVYRKSLSIADMLIAAVFIILAAIAMRFFVYLGIVAAYVLAPIARLHVSNLSTKRKEMAILSGVCLLLLVLVVTCGNASKATPKFHPYNESLSPPMARVLEDSVHQGNVFNSFTLGAELVYRAYPRMRPTIDSRIDSYGNDYFLFSQALLRDKELMDHFVNKYSIKYMLLTLADEDSLRSYLSSHNWERVLSDDQYVFLEQH